MQTAERDTTTSRTRAKRKTPAAPTGGASAPGPLPQTLPILFELPAAVEMALLACHAAGQGTTSYQGMRSAAFDVFGIGR